jgi:maleylpyruvate isomerase
MTLFGYWRSSSSWRVRIALNLKGLAYQSVSVNLPAGAQHGAEHRKLSPAGYVPVLQLDGGVALTQSIAILEYLEEKFPTPPLLPRDPVDRAHVRALAELVNSGMQPFQNLSTLNYVRGTLKGDDKAWAQQFLKPALEALETLAAPKAGRFLHGEQPTFADCLLVPQLYGARRFGVETSSFKLLTRIEAACQELDAFKRAAADAQPDAVQGA